MTPDGQHIVGPVPGAAGLFVASGCNVAGLSIAPAIGEELARLDRGRPALRGSRRHVDRALRAGMARRGAPPSSGGLGVLALLLVRRPGAAEGPCAHRRTRAAAFRALHQRPGAFIIPNPWDAGTARLLASLGFEALATTSLGLANSLGRPDGAGAVSRGRGPRQLPGDRRRDRPARQRRPGERVRARAARRRRDDPAGGGGGRRGRLDRGRDRGPGDADLRVLPGGRARARRGRGGAVPAGPVHADGAGGEPPPRPPRPRRHDPAAAGLRAGRRGRALRARAPGPRRRSAPSSRR